MKVNIVNIGFCLLIDDALLFAVIVYGRIYVQDKPVDVHEVEWKVLFDLSKPIKVLDFTFSQLICVVFAIHIVVCYSFKVNVYIL